MSKPMAKPFVPPTIYHDGINIFLDWGTYAQKFPFTEGGLNKALKLIPHVASHPGYVTGRSNIADKLLDTRHAKIAAKTKAKREIATIPEGQRQGASSILRKLRSLREKQ